ncbi:Uma2 family endonuclease [Sphingomonas sp. MS122]|uniref:Uma2 family endonuclease n=1 Tax=Sphingomonas sp. MS122 TaxID=3412683 RepID=UPI003C2F2587
MTAQEALTTPHLAKLRVADFLLLAESGAFDDYARTELIEGEIWVVNSVHRRHARAHAQFTAEIGAALKAIGSPLTFYAAPSTELSDDSLPEPDIAIGEVSDAKIFPGPAMRVAVEISDSTLDIDLGRKARLYARHGVPEYWVVDVEGRVIHQMWAPEGEVYRQQGDVAFGETLNAATVSGLTVDTGSL